MESDPIKTMLNKSKQIKSSNINNHLATPKGKNSRAKKLKKKNQLDRSAVRAGAGLSEEA